MKARSLLMALLLMAVLFASAPDLVSAQGKNACKGKNKKNCEVPEVPWTLVLPIATAAIAGGYYLVQRRREDDLILDR